MLMLLAEASHHATSWQDVARIAVTLFGIAAIIWALVH